MAPQASHTTEHDRDKMTTVKLLDCEVLHADLSQLLITEETFLRMRQDDCAITTERNPFESSRFTLPRHSGYSFLIPSPETNLQR
jgi:hypothetical protein